MTEPNETPEIEIDELPEGIEPEEQSEQEETPESRLEKAEARAQDKEKMAMAERRKRQAAERRRIELEERLEALEAATRQPQRSNVSIDDIDVEGDPIGAIEKLTALAKSLQAQQQQDEEASVKTVKERREFSRLSDMFASQEEEYASTQADYPKARDFLLKAIYEEVTDEGYAGQEAAKLTGERFNEVVLRLLRSERDAPEVIYSLAKRRGYGLDNAGKKIDLIRKGQQAGRSLSNAPAQTGEKSVSYDQVSKLKGSAKLEAYQKLRAQELRREGRG